VVHDGSSIPALDTAADGSVVVFWCAGGEFVFVLVTVLLLVGGVNIALKSSKSLSSFSLCIAILVDGGSPDLSQAFNHSAIGPSR